jgi:hypothetical protein
VADLLFKRAKQIGSVVFFIVVAIAVFKNFSHKDEKIPSAALGCYHSERSPDIVISPDKIAIGQDGIGEILSSYRVDNVGPAILTTKPLLLKPVAEGRYKFFIEDRAGRYVRFLPGPPASLEITAADGMVISYDRIECGGPSGTKAR